MEDKSVTKYLDEMSILELTNMVTQLNERMDLLYEKVSYLRESIILLEKVTEKLKK